MKRAFINNGQVFKRTCCNVHTCVQGVPWLSSVRITLILFMDEWTSFKKGQFCLQN